MAFSLNNDVVATTVNAGVVGVTQNIEAKTVTTTNIIVVEETVDTQPAAVDVFEKYSGSTPPYSVGTKFTHNGRTFRFCELGNQFALQIQAGNIVGRVPNTTTYTVTAQDTYAKTVTFVAPAGGYSENELSGLTYVCEDGNYALTTKVLSNNEAAVGENVVLTLEGHNYQNPGVEFYLVNSDYIISPFKVASNITPIGVAVSDLFNPVPTHAWIQTGGICGVKMGSGLAAGETAVAGDTLLVDQVKRVKRLGDAATATELRAPIIGTAMSSGSSDAICVTDLNLETS